MNAFDHESCVGQIYEGWVQLNKLNVGMLVVAIGASMMFYAHIEFNVFERTIVKTSRSLVAKPLINIIPVAIESQIVDRQVDTVGHQEPGSIVTRIPGVGTKKYCGPVAGGQGQIVGIHGDLTFCNVTNDVDRVARARGVNCGLQGC